MSRRARLSSFAAVFVLAFLPALSRADAVVVKGETCFVNGVAADGTLSAECGAEGTAKIVENNNKIKVTCKASVQNKSGAPYSEKVRIVIDFNGEKVILTDSLHISAAGQATVEVEFKQ